MKPNLDSLLNQLESEELAHRLMTARTSRKLLQQTAAERLQISRPTFINIEKGLRRISARELLLLADLYQTDPYDLVALALEDTDLTVQFRRTLESQDLIIGEEKDELDVAIKQLQQMAILYLELEQLLGRKHIFNINTQFQLNGHRDMKAYAALVARQERQRLQLGDEPIPHLFSLLEEEYRVRVFRFALPRGISGFYGYARGLGGCIALNENHPLDRQLQTAAHETGHVLTSAQNTQVQVLNGRVRSSPEEQFAGYFGMNFTLPEGGVRRLIYDCVERNNGEAPSITDLVAMAHQYSVSFEAFLRRLVDLDFLPSGDVKRLISHKVVKKTKGDLGLLTSVPTDPVEKILARYPERYKQYLVEAYEKALVEPQEIVAKYLVGLELTDISRVVAQYTRIQHMRDDGSVVSINFEGYQERLNWKFN